MFWSRVGAGELGSNNSFDLGGGRSYSPDSGVMFAFEREGR